jgi:hypothetical protein
MSNIQPFIMKFRIKMPYLLIGMLLCAQFTIATLQAQTTINFVANQPPPPVSKFGTEIQADRLTFVFTDSSSSGLFSRKWLFGDGDSAVGNLTTVLHQYPSKGIYNACLIVTDFNGCTATRCNLVSSFVGIQEGGLSVHQFQVAPNPYRNKTVVSYYLPKSSIVLLELYNITGARVKTLVNANESAGEKRLDLFSVNDGSSKGMYFLKLTIDGVEFVQKIVELH